MIGVTTSVKLATVKYGGLLVIITIKLLEKLSPQKSFNITYITWEPISEKEFKGGVTVTTSEEKAVIESIAGGIFTDDVTEQPSGSV